METSTFISTPPIALRLRPSEEGNASANSITCHRSNRKAQRGRTYIAIFTPLNAYPQRDVIPRGKCRCFRVGLSVVCPGPGAFTAILTISPGLLLLQLNYLKQGDDLYFSRSSRTSSYLVHFGTPRWLHPTRWLFSEPMCT